MAKVAADGLLLENGEHVDADAVAWTTGFKVSPLAREAGLAVDDHGAHARGRNPALGVAPGGLRHRDAAAARKQDGQVLRMGCGCAA